VLKQQAAHLKQAHGCTYVPYCLLGSLLLRFMVGSKLLLY
jgi:hypothetical protein